MKPAAPPASSSLFQSERAAAAEDDLKWRCDVPGRKKNAAPHFNFQKGNEGARRGLMGTALIIKEEIDHKFGSLKSTSGPLMTLACNQFSSCHARAVSLCPVTKRHVRSSFLLQEAEIKRRD